MQFGRPDWVMLGVPGPVPGGKVWLIASRELTRAELEVAVNYEDIWDDEVFPVTSVLTSRKITLSCQMGKFVLIEADDYAAAFNALFEQWSPQPGQRVALPGTPALPPGEPIALPPAEEDRHG
jgi:hypothetical protein